MRQRRRKALAGIAILLGTTAVTAMLALATTIGDRIHRELAVYGANIVVTPKADALDVKVGGEDLKPATGGASLKESDLEKLKNIFWANNITGVSPEYDRSLLILKPINQVEPHTLERASVASAMELWFNHDFNGHTTGAPALHPWWKLQGRWPKTADVREFAHAEDGAEIVLGARLATRLHLNIGDWFRFQGSQGAGYAPEGLVVGIVTSGDTTEDKVLLPFEPEILPEGTTNDPQISRVEISARTRPEDAFARLDPDKLSPKQHDIWYCRPYANSIAYQIMEAIPGSRAEQVRRVEQSEGTVLSRISGLMWLVSGAALLAAGFAVSAAMATAVLERRGEIGLMRSLGASKAAIALLFYAESGLLAVVAGAVGFVAGSGLAFWLGGRIFPGATAEPLLNMALLPVVVGLALVVAIAGSTPSIRAALKMDPSGVLRAGA